MLGCLAFFWPAVVTQQVRCRGAKLEDAGSIPGHGGGISMEAKCRTFVCLDLVAL